MKIDADRVVAELEKLAEFSDAPPHRRTLGEPSSHARLQSSAGALYLASQPSSEFARSICASAPLPVNFTSPAPAAAATRSSSSRSTLSHKPQRSATNTG